MRRSQGLREEGMMLLKTFAGAADFLREVHAYLGKQEVVNGLMLGLAIRLADEPLAYGNAPYFAAVTDAYGPVLTALMTPPHNLILYSDQESVPEALELVALDLIERQWPVAGTAGPVRLVEMFSNLWTRLTGITDQPGMSQRIYMLRQVVHPHYSPGRLRLAAEGDADLVIKWMDAFWLEAAPSGPRFSPDALYQRIAQQTLFLWDHHGPVSVALKTRPTSHGICISGAYTPPQLRRRGYATSCVAALSQRLLDAGFEFCTLFTDLSNPTSNDIYQKIGYRPVCDFQEIKFIHG
jgi:uncharacterized protein